MNSQIKQILKLNKKFYQSVSKEFSISRQLTWKGWERAMGVFLSNHDNNKKNIKILDLGCGNGRFLGYIPEKIKIFSYTGCDTNNDLLLEAKKKYKSGSRKTIKFVNKDIVSDLSKIKSNYDLVVCFGVTHHIPDNSYRLSWFNTLSKLIREKGVLIITFWDFDEKPGDYLIGWDNKNIARYCHQYSVNELNKIKSNFKNKGLKLLDEYKADHKNYYLIFGNI